MSYNAFRIRPDFYVMETNGSTLAHIRQDALVRHEHELDAHLYGVARLAASFGQSFGHGEWGRLAGLWHDLGKYRPGFQRYIRQANDADAHIEGRVAGRDKTQLGLLDLDRLAPDRLTP